MADFKSLMRSSREAYVNAERANASRSGAEKIPDGEYIAELTKSACGVSKKGRPQIAREHIVREGEFKGFVLSDYVGLDTERSFEFLHKWFTALGVDGPENPEDLPEFLDELLAVRPICRIQTKQSGDFTNVYPIELVSEGNPAEEEEEEEEKKPAQKASVKKSKVVEPEPEPEPEEEDESEVDEVDFDDMTRAELKAYVKDNELDIKITPKMDDDALRDAIRALVDEEEESSDAEEETDDELSGLLTFADAHEIEIEDRSDVQTVKDEISGWEFQEEELTEEEIELLERNELSECIARPAPKAKKGKK